MNQKVTVLIIDGSARPESETRRALPLIASAVEENGGESAVFDQRVHRLPLYRGEESAELEPEAKRLLDLVAAADALVLSSPEYHGSISGALKNALDWLTLLPAGSDLSGKVVGLVGGGGALANSGATVQMMMSVRAMHGWLVPEGVLSVPNVWDAFADDGSLKDPALRKRVDAFAAKLVRYAGHFKAHAKLFRSAA